jgi:hypothetical protein
MTDTISVRIRGQVVGQIWMPATEAWKDFDETFEKGRFGNIRLSRQIESLDEALDKITNDGDFQSCRIGNAFVTISYQSGKRTISRSFDLKGVSYPEYFAPDYPWYPPMDEA